MFKRNKLNREGIIALFPAIIISSIMIILCVGASKSFLSLLYRTTIFDEKIQSNIVAHSCTLRVLAKHIQDSAYRGGENIMVGNDSCSVGLFSTTTSYVSVKIGEAVSLESVSY